MKIQETVEASLPIGEVARALDGIDYSKTLSLFSRKIGLFDTMGWREVEFPAGNWEGNTYCRQWFAKPFPCSTENGSYLAEQSGDMVRITYTSNVSIPWYLFSFLFPEFALRISMRQSLEYFVGLVKKTE